MALAACATAAPFSSFAQDAAPAKAAVCAACHGPEGKSADPMYPILAGQTSRYLYLELRDFQEGRRSDPQMSPMAAGLTRDEMRELADYFAKQ
ncbi:MAG: c-type cytochrome, partial [Pseudomonadota bacterium]|nr:c-type cytochrome [Pseudomonadota bacterium]